MRHILLLFVLIVSINVINLFSNAQLLLSDVGSLTFYNDRYANTLLTPSKPQMICMSPAELCLEANKKSITCFNKDKNPITNEILWDCIGDYMRDSHSVSSANVICENYDGFSTNYLVDGSCYVEYNIVTNNRYVFVIMMTLIFGCIILILAYVWVGRQLGDLDDVGADDVELVGGGTV